jgi:hypothetical protein
MQSRKSLTQQQDETKIIHGWVYGLAEPYQIFIIYIVLIVLGKKRFDDLRDIMEILDSFEMISKK